MRPTWIMQTNLVSEFEKWRQALTECESLWKPIEIIPFSDGVPDVEVDGPALVYGTTTLIKNAPKKNWNPGTFFNPSGFKPSLWAKMYGDEMFNSDGKVIPIRELLDHVEKDVFLRPDDDMKDFSGSRIDRAGAMKFVTEVLDGEFPFDANLNVFIAPIKPIYKEYRVFIVNQEPVSWSQYRLRSMLAKDIYVPRKALQYAREMAHLWSPEKAFVMDICTEDEKTFKILELNCFNASGVYDCDVVQIIEAVERLF